MASEAVFSVPPGFINLSLDILKAQASLFREFENICLKVKLYSKE